MTNTPAVGRVVHLVVPRHTNSGQDHVPAIITRVVDSSHVDVHAFGRNHLAGDDLVRGVRLLDNRAKAAEALAFHYSDLPGAHLHQHPDGREELIPGTNPQSGQPWNHSDVAHWHHYAYWPDRDDQAAAPAEVPDVAESDQDRRARLLAELAELDARAGA